MFHHFTSLPSSDPHVSRKHEQPDREEHDSREFRDRGAWGCWSIAWIDCHVARARIISPVEDARVDSFVYRHFPISIFPAASAVVNAGAPSGVGAHGAGPSSFGAVVTWPLLVS